MGAYGNLSYNIMATATLIDIRPKHNCIQYHNII